MRIGHIELFVKDPKASKIFFCNILGFEFVSDQGDYQWVKLGNNEILLRPGIDHKSISSYQDSSSGIVLYTDDLNQTEKDLKKKGLIFKGIDGSEDCMTFTDLDGHWFQLVNPNH